MIRREFLKGVMAVLSAGAASGHYEQEPVLQAVPEATEDARAAFAAPLEPFCQYEFKTDQGLLRVFTGSLLEFPDDHPSAALLTALKVWEEVCVIGGEINKEIASLHLGGDKPTREWVTRIDGNVTLRRQNGEIIVAQLLLV